uniref:Uncharacterized protein n=2 Tax=Paenibacillus athensensis TaxID=1967502 RepID=A0A4Y8Q756_9BACL
MVKMSLWTLVFLLVWVGGYWWTHREKGPDPALKSVVANYVGSDGAIHDPTGDLGVTNKEDVSFQLKGDQLAISYGKQLFRIDLRKDGQDVFRSLQALGVTVEQDANGRVTVRYHGEAVKRFE